jgi:anti-sigma-K factor RskA
VSAPGYFSARKVVRTVVRLPALSVAVATMLSVRVLRLPSDRRPAAVGRSRSVVTPALLSRPVSRPIVRVPSRSEARIVQASLHSARTRTVARTETVTRTVRAPQRQPGVLERETALAAVGGGVAKAAVRITRVGPGRIVELRSSTLAKLPASQYYELWFVGPGDAPGAPNRVSAGTFHPDSRGRVVARFFAAANPRKLPVIAVTREARDGNPAATLPDVLRSASGGP